MKCPDRPSELGLTVPTDNWWAGQQQTIDMIIDAFERNKKFVMAGIPTGGGKTLIAAAVQKLLQRAGGAGNSIALTHTIQLQNQYAKTLPDAAIVTGRSNHPCILSPNDPARLGESPSKPLTAATAPCSESDCPDGKAVQAACPYFVQYAEGQRSEATIMNYAFACRVFASGKWERELLVADECHLTEPAVTQAAEIRFWMRPFIQAGLQLPGEDTKTKAIEGGPRSQKEVWYETTAVWQAHAKGWLVTANERLVDARNRVKTLTEKVKNEGSGADHLMAAKGAYRSLQALCSALRGMAGMTDYAGWTVTREKNYRGEIVSVVAKPLWGKTVADGMLFRGFKRVLLMSATPGDPTLARMKLGIEEEDFEFIDRPSTFPIENRPIIFWDVAKLNYQSNDDDWDRVARAIGFIATRPAYIQRKGLVHSGSASNAQKLVRILNKYLPGRAFTHDKTGGMSREDALDHFIETAPSDAIFVTASFTTGLDLPYMIGWQVIAKVPFGSLTDEITARRKAYKMPNGFEFGAKNYDAETANTIVQAAGRICRAPDDTGPTFILDGNFKMLKARAYFPKFFLDAYSVFRVDL